VTDRTSASYAVSPLASLDEAEGALWNRAIIDAGRVDTAPEHLTRVVVAIDPSGTSEGAPECGICVCAKCPDGHGYVLLDASARLSPERWARRAVELFDAYRADRIIAEKNFGGEMVERCIHTIRPHEAVKLVSASRGKAVRAEPIVSLYEQHRAHHVGMFPTLEDQLCGWVPGTPGPSPDRLDALVWGLSELLVETTGTSLETWAALIGSTPDNNRRSSSEVMAEVYGRRMW
jgi:phage terminase large subunit-like protein